MQKFDQLLLKIEDMKKNYEAKQMKINVGGVMTLIMAGAMDSLFDKELTLQERFAAIEAFKKAMGSQAKIPSARAGGGMGMDEIHDDFSRNLWLTNTNPLFSFKVCDYYKDAVLSMGFKATGTQHLRYRKERTGMGNPVDIFGSFNSLFEPRTLSLYSNRNIDRQPGIVAIYRGYSTQTWGAGNKMRKVIMNDGTSESTGVIWPERGTSDVFDKKLDHALNLYRDKACLFVGKLQVSSRGFKSFCITDIIPFS